MKISASIYSDKKRPLKEVIQDLVDHNVDLLHVDCNDDLAVFDDIREIRTWCNIPIDLHIITENPSKYMDLLIENPVEYVTFQFEDLKEPLIFPKEVTGKKGLAIITPTSIDAFDAYDDYDFILIMATIPGQSGGVFDTWNYSKIRSFKKKYPSKSIHVDGGVNAEVSFILRNMGVSSSVSGSYLFNAPSIGHALMNLTQRDVTSHFKVKDFMTPINETPCIQYNDLNLKNVLECIEVGQLGFCIVIGENNQFRGLISNADVRKGLIKQLDNLSNVDTISMVNQNPVTINEENTVNEMLNLIKKCLFPVMYLPVINRDREATGIVTFVNLIKSEL
jgi:ribulose-phosphate 3-epimerase